MVIKLYSEAKLTLCLSKLPWWRRWGVGTKLHTFLKSLLISNQLRIPAALYPGKNYRTNRTGGWVGPRAGLL